MENSSFVGNGSVRQALEMQRRAVDVFDPTDHKFRRSVSCFENHLECWLDWEKRRPMLANLLVDVVPKFFDLARLNAVVRLELIA